MNTGDARTFTDLARLNPAPDRSADGGAVPLSPAQSRRADLVLDRILATDPDMPPARSERVLPGSRRWSRRWVLVPLAALVAAIAVVVPVISTGGDKAYASWSPLPVPLTRAESEAAALACLAAVDRQTAVPVIPLLAERRGGWTYVLVRPAKNVQASCLMPTDEVAAPPRADRRRWFWSDDEEVLGPVRDAEGIRVDGAATGTTKEGLFRYSEGAVGRDVVDLTFTTPRGVTVKASVANGRYAVWWPAGKNDLRSPEFSGAPKIDVTLADGTTYRLPR